MASASKVFLLSSFLLLALIACQALAFSESENLDHVEKILSLLNNETKCLLPTYQEVNELQRRINELEAAWGSEADLRLSNDQKLAKKTLLDQWTSFQSYLNTETVTKPAKRRAFLGKVENYQRQKHGFSICIKKPNERVQEEHEVIEKNPLVRYVKKLKYQGGQPLEGGSLVTSLAQAGLGANSDSKPEPPKSQSTRPILEDADVELKFRVPPKRGDSDQRPKQYSGKFYFQGNGGPRTFTLQIGDRKQEFVSRYGANK